MEKRKYILACLAVMCLAWFGAGCGGEEEFTAGLEGHKAVKLYLDGVWEPRYASGSAMGSGGKNDSAQVVLSVDVKEEMEEDEMMEVVDYYRMLALAAYDTGDGLDFICYAIFFQGDTNEELFRVKCRNGEKAEPAKEDSSIFPLPGMRDDRRHGLPERGG